VMIVQKKLVIFGNGAGRVVTDKDIAPHMSEEEHHVVGEASEDGSPPKDDDPSDEGSDADEDGAKKGAKAAAAKPAAAAAKPAKAASAAAKGKTMAAKEGGGGGGPKKISETDKWVLEFLESRNRPYSAVGVSDNSGGVVKKGPAEKALTALHEAGRIACKDLKKQKVYFATQTNFEVPDVEELAGREAAIKQLAEEVAALERDNKAVAAVLHQLSAQKSDDELDRETEVALKAVADLEARLLALRSGTQLVDDKEKARLQALYETNRSLWRKRKRIAQDVIEAVCGDAKRPKDLMDELGIDTDEQMNVTLDGTALAYKKAKP